MGGAPMWPVPRAIDAEAHHYPRRWFRNSIIINASVLLLSLQVGRYALMVKQGTMAAGEYMDWGSHDAPKRVRF